MVESDVSLDEFRELDGVTCTRINRTHAEGGEERNRGFYFSSFWRVRVWGLDETNLTLRSRPLEGED